MSRILKYIKYLIAVVFIIPLFIVVYLLIELGNFILYKMGKVLAAEKYKAAMVHFIVRWINFFLGIRLKVEGRDNLPPIMSGGAIVANHQSLLDCVVIEGTGAWCGFVGKAELKKVPVLNGFFRVINGVFIDRKSPRNSIKAILDASNNIKKGYVMAIFPEGTRSKDGEVHEFKAGSFKMATRSGAPIYPVAIYGTRNILETCRSLFPQKVYIKCAPAIETKDLSEEELKEVHTLAENKVREMYEDLRARYKK